MAAQQAQYDTSVDVRDVAKDPKAFKNHKLKYSGSVLTIFQDAKLGTQIQLTVGDTTLLVLFADQHAGDGVYQGDRVTIWLRPQKAQTFDNTIGGKTTQALCYGDFIAKQ